MVPFIPIHQHMIMRANINFTMSSPYMGKEMLSDLVKYIGMVAVTDPQVVYVSGKGNEGLTGSINLATSHIAFHIWDEPLLLMLDVYSCKPFEPEDVLTFLGERFGGLTNITGMVINREDMTATEL